MSCDAPRTRASVRTDVLSCCACRGARSRRTSSASEGLRNRNEKARPYQDSLLTSRALPFTLSLIPARTFEENAGRALSGSVPWSRTMSRGLIPALLFAFSGIIFFGLGNLLAARAVSANENDQIAALRAEVGALKRRSETSGTSGRSTEGVAATMDAHSRAALVADIKQQ